jgi:ABC-2 type transport system permease protein
MLLRIAWFELRQRLRMLSTYVYFAIFFGMGFFWICLAGGAFPSASVDFGAGGKVRLNTPLSLLLLMMLAGYLGTIITAAIAGRATYKDIEHQSTSFFFTAPISKAQYLGGRFLGAFLCVMVIYPGVALGAALAMKAPFIDATRVGPSMPMAYVSPYFTILLPNLVFTSSVFFALATLLRKMVPVYVGAVVLVLGYLVASSITGNLDNKTVASLTDPFGGTAAALLTEYWTIAEKNTRMVPLTGLFLWNRALWTGIGVALLALTYVRFSFSEGLAGKPKSRSDEAALRPAPAQAPIPTLDFSRRAAFGALFTLTRMQLRETVKNVFFLVIVLAAVLFVIVVGREADEIYGTRTWPVTYEVLEVVGSTFTLFIVVIIAFYSGELVWRERDAGLASIFDALPVPRWVIFTSKLAALMLVQVLLLAVLTFAGIALQASKGYFHFELGEYAETLLLVRLPAFWFLCCMAMLVHVVVDNKYVGHFVVVLYVVVGIALPILGLEHHLYRMGTVPRWTYSDMNGFGPFVAPIAAFLVYWGALAVVFAIVANALWVRGMEGAIKQRLALAWSTRSRGAATAAACALVVFAGTGAFIFWNTNLRNHYTTSHDQEARQVTREKTYASWQDVAQPKIEAVKVACDIFPAERRAAIRGTYTLHNESGQPIPRILVHVPRSTKIRKLVFGRGEERTLADATLGFYVYDLPAPLAPGDRATLDFEVTLDNPGFTNEGAGTEIVDSGSFFNDEVLPHIGYDDLLELQNDADRHKFGLAPKHLPPAGDPKGSSQNYFVVDSHWMTLDATVSTSEDQLAFAPGYLDREWTEGGRHYFHYAMSSKILGFYAFLSGKYAVRKDHWSAPPGAMPGSPPDVAIEIDYHAGHEYDLDRMVKSVKQSLDYYTTNFGPYQHHQVRIIEFPRYESFAQSFPNTIPFSESIGFIARVDDSKPDDIDYPFYVTAHEVAHQWWAHQVIGGHVQGSTMLSETMAQYSALMVMKHQYGADKMRKFLRYELDQYLRGRSNEKRAETPLVRVENEPYIHYRKGSVVMYALQDYIGEDAVNRVLARFVAAHKFRGPPYPDAPELVAAFREETPEEYRYVIEDLFETITLYENRATRATYVKRPDGQFDVTVEVETKKLRASDVGAETQIAMSDFVDVGAVDEDGKALVLERKKITTPSATFTFTVPVVPAKAGIDPLNKLIDRMPDDNVIKVEAAGG